MLKEDHEALPPEQRLALSYTRPDLRPALASFFALDRRFGQIVAKTSEPVMGQMRLAWWREQLEKPVGDRPAGDFLLDAVSQYWAGQEEGMVSLVDGWEELLVIDNLTRAEAKRFCSNRARPLALLAARCGSGAGVRAQAAGERWAAADAAVHVSSDEEREVLLATGLGRTSGKGGIPRSMRGLAVLEALALRSMRRGGRPLMDGRGAALTALRAGLLGR